MVYFPDMHIDQTRPTGAYCFPWYDAWWLTSYWRARDHLAQHHPGVLPDFLEAMSVFRTPADFRVIKLADVFTDAEHAMLVTVANKVLEKPAEMHELFTFGRLVLHNHPSLNELQYALTDRMSEWVGEAVQPCYNFLSLYNNLGVCEPHLDAPQAKWTLDYCIRQSEPWPIRFSQILDWPEPWKGGFENWQEKVLTSDAHEFSAEVLQEKEALVFSGSSQWHYRERISREKAENFCHLVFFHFIPAGQRQLVDPGNWAEIFGIPALARICIAAEGEFLPDPD
jgi:hypothetical protein